MNFEDKSPDILKHNHKLSAAVYILSNDTEFRQGQTIYFMLNTTHYVVLLMIVLCLLSFFVEEFSLLRYQIFKAIISRIHLHQQKVL